MITYKTGDMFDSKAEALVNTVNIVGVMGKGIALQFKKLFPANFKMYKKKCDTGEFSIGELMVHEDTSLMTGEKIIINFPTKKHWRHPSKYEYIKSGVKELKALLIERKIKSIAIPPLGSGNGGLEWSRVRDILESELLSLKEIDIFIYEPNSKVKAVLNQERVKLTDARSLLLYGLFRLVRNGEFVSEFASEKICYFFQRFGAEKIFNLKYSPNYYGPYSGKVRHLLYLLNGSYIKGYETKDKKPFDYLSLILDAEDEVTSYINKKPELLKIAETTCNFLEGYYSSFGLELLSTVDFLAKENNTSNFIEIREAIGEWSDRKKTLFSNDSFIQQSVDHLVSAQLI